MKAFFTLIGIAMITIMLTGCESLKAALPFLGSSTNQIEAVLAAQAAGVYTVEFRKDGNILVSETWECTKDVTTGKLTGCHKR